MKALALAAAVSLVAMAAGEAQTRPSTTTKVATVSSPGPQ